MKFCELCRWHCVSFKLKSSTLDQHDQITKHWFARMSHMSSGKLISYNYAVWRKKFLVDVNQRKLPSKSLFLIKRSRAFLSRTTTAAATSVLIPFIHIYVSLPSLSCASSTDNVGVSMSTFMRFIHVFLGLPFGLLLSSSNCGASRIWFSIPRHIS